ncbi:transcription antitermination protein RfaH [mine drainage metagenome]|uniref:Transcription antitermination protein RfaH n=1 Tax=mine drainage metagenome TaxID=410659 RepID=A0A1J5TFN9_9ZZZZ
MAVPIQSFQEPRWFVCHTKPRCEKKFAALMEAESFTHYLPLVRSVRNYADRKRTFMKPLFLGYVFAEITPERKTRIYQQDLLVRAIWVEDQPLFLRQLEDVRRVVESGLETTLQPLLKRGTLVRITAGPLKGVEGFVEDPKSPRGVVIAMDVLQQGLLVPVPIDQIKVLV